MPKQPNKNYWSWSFALMVSAFAPGSPYAGQIPEPITIEDLAGRVQIPLISLAPDGSRVAYLAVKGLPLENLYEISVNLQATEGKSQPFVLSHYRLPPESVFERDSGGIQGIAGQFAWSPDGKELAYSVHFGSQMEVR